MMLLAHLNRCCCLLILSTYCLISFSTNFLPLATLSQHNLQKALDDYRISEHYPAVSLSIKQGQLQQDYVSGTIIKGQSNALTKYNVMQAGSITKSFVSALVLQLSAANQIDLNATLASLLPQYTQWSTVTVRQLLNHSSGIFNFTDSDDFKKQEYNNPDKHWTDAQLVTFAEHEKSYFKPGTGWHYSNTDYILLGLIINKITQQSLAEELNQRFLNNPAYNLQYSFYYLGHYPAWLKELMAHGYLFQNPQYLDITFFDNSWQGAAGALVSRPHDLIQWFVSLMDGNVLAPKQQAQLQSLVAEKNGQAIKRPAPGQFAYGLGIRAYYDPKLKMIWWHDGGTLGYKSLVLWVPSHHIYLSLMVDVVQAGAEATNMLTPKSKFVQQLLAILS